MNKQLVVVCLVWLILLTVWMFKIQFDVLLIKNEPIERFIYNVEPKQQKPIFGIMPKE